MLTCRRIQTATSALPPGATSHTEPTETGGVVLVIRLSSELCYFSIYELTQKITPTRPPQKKGLKIAKIT